MTEQPVAYPGYATPTYTRWDDGGDVCWLVGALPWTSNVGFARVANAGWTAHTPTGLYVGLFPTQQAAGEALVKHAGYEVLR